MIFFTPFWFFFSPYIKKEDVKDFLKRQRKFISLILIFFAIVVAIIHLSVSPKLIGMYKDFNLPVPLMTQLSPYVFLIIMSLLLVLSVYLLATPPNFSSLDIILSKYKSGEMIRTREVINFKYEIGFFIFFGLVISYLVLSYIVPIYNLSGQF